MPGSPEVVSTAYTFLTSTLTGDSTLMGLVQGVYADVAPPGTDPKGKPYCIVAEQSGTDVMTATAHRVLTQMLYQAKVVSLLDNFPAISQAYARVDSLLAKVANQGGVICCFRESVLYLQEEVGGVPLVSLGGLYRIQI